MKVMLWEKVGKQKLDIQLRQYKTNYTIEILSWGKWKVLRSYPKNTNWKLDERVKFERDLKQLFNEAVETIQYEILA